MELSCIRVWHACTTAPRLGRVLLGAVYGFVDGVVAGLGLGWLYSAFDGGTRAVSRQMAPFRDAAYSGSFDRMCVNTASVLQGAGAAFQMLRAFCIF